MIGKPSLRSRLTDPFEHRCERGSLCRLHAPFRPQRSRSCSDTQQCSGAGTSHRLRSQHRCAPDSWASYWPVPVSFTLCGEPLALSATLRAAVRAPFAAGLKVTDMVHFCPAATLVPQVFVCVKSTELAPVTEIEIPVSGPVPELVSVTV